MKRFGIHLLRHSLTVAVLMFLQRTLPARSGLRRARPQSDPTLDINATDSWTNVAGTPCSRSKPECSQECSDFWQPVFPTERQLNLFFVCQSFVFLVTFCSLLNLSLHHKPTVLSPHPTH